MTAPLEPAVTSDESTPEHVQVPQRMSDRPGVIFTASLLIRMTLASAFLGSADAMNALAVIPPASTHTFFYLPYFPIVQNILGATTPLVNHAQFIPIGLTVKLLPCVVDSLLSVWLLQNNRLDRRYRRSAAWLYAFCPLPLILICMDGQWDSLWVLPALTAVAMADLLTDESKSRQTTLLLIGALLGLAVLSKPSAFIIAGLLLPSFRYRKSLFGWCYDAALVVMGGAATVVLFFLKFAANGVHVHQNITDALQYADQPQSTLFGLANLSVLRHFNTVHSSALQDLRHLAIVYVIGITVYQLVARRPVDRMSAAAALLLICPAIGGLSPQYLFWPLLFILASGRIRLASVYATISACVYFLFFLIPGASFNRGVNLGALLPLRSLQFLGLPIAALKWFARPAVLSEWHVLANLIVPLAMCGLGVYLLVSQRIEREGLLAVQSEPLQLRSIRTIVPYTVIMVLIVFAYGLVSTHDARPTIASITRGVNHYAFAHPIFSWHLWSKYYFWTTQHPYRDVLGGNWWGTILVLGPLGIALWSVFALHTDRHNPRAHVNRDSA
jgi:hypothetical protein